MGVLLMAWGNSAISAASSCIQRVSTDASGALTGKITGYDGYLSGDGRYVALSTDQPYAPDDTNGVADVYLKDMQTGAFERMSVGNAGEQFTGFGISGGR